MTRLVHHQMMRGGGPRCGGGRPADGRNLEVLRATCPACLADVNFDELIRQEVAKATFALNRAEALRLKAKANR